MPPQRQSPTHLHVIDGQSIATDASQSIGASLDDLVGVSSSDYGAAVGQPIIRGMSGSSVRVLNNGVVVRDVSGLGPDHINDVDLNNIQQIEVSEAHLLCCIPKAPLAESSILLITRLPEQDFAESEFKLGLEAQTVNRW